MTAPLRAALGIAAFLHAAAAQAASPEIGAYLTDQGEDVFVAVYENFAIDLAGCSSADDARTLLQLPSDQPVRRFRRSDLVADLDLGAHPRLPCGHSRDFDIDWPAATPIWADLTASANYYLPALEGGGVYYAVPTSCEAVKAALAIRERIQLPGVLQGIAAPDDMSEVHVFGCGLATSVPTPPAPASAAWSLHVFDTFLSEDSTGDRIYVARLNVGGGAAARASYLPIWRVDGTAAGDIIFGNDARSRETETALRGLFGQPDEVEITLLRAEAVGPVRSAIFVDLCLSDCGGYQHSHGYFVQPGVDPALTILDPRSATSQIDLLGQEQIAWEFAPGRRVVFSGCNRLVESLGVEAGTAASWNDAVETALESADLPGQGFDCAAAADDICIRSFPEGAAITAASISPGTDCAGASRVRIELAATAILPGALSFSNPPFDVVEIVPAAGIARSILSGVASPPQMAASDCVLAPAMGLIAASGISRLKLSRLDLRRSESGGGGGEVAAIQVERGILALEDVTIGSEAANTLPVERGVSLCHGELYAVRSNIAADALALQAVASRALVTGTEGAPATISGRRFGGLLSAHSTLRLHRAQISAPNSIVAKDSRLTVTRSEFRSGPDGRAGHALRLERDSRAELTTSIVRGFSCVGTFVDSLASAAIILPGNNLADDNTHLSCGNGSVAVLE